MIDDLLLHCMIFFGHQPGPIPASDTLMIMYLPGLARFLLWHCKSCHGVVSATGPALQCVLHLEIMGQHPLHGLCWTPA